MKKLFLLAILFVLTMKAMSQVSSSFPGEEPAIIYALPKAELCIEVVTEKTTQKPGPFYRYSERYLATNKVITEEKTSYRLKSIQIVPHAVPDPARTYSFVPTGNLQSSHLSLTSTGILCGVNVPAEIEGAAPQVSALSLKENSKQDALLPLGEEYMLAGSEIKLAEGAAKQIYRIRESRLGLLTADAEKLPADGDSFKSMLEGMNKMERELTELFVGKTIAETQIQKLYLTPTNEITNDVLFRLSALKGLVNADDLSGTPYYISIKLLDVKQNSGKAKAKTEKGGIYYILPASTQVTIGDGVNTLLSGQFYIPQFGIAIPLPESIFKQPGMKVQLDAQTGRLLRVE
ncbi:MAG: DUF4831 family protein [Bacteroidota bacterium]|nr:DUF4831 family protein [Bacteroidota bacterium]